MEGSKKHSDATVTDQSPFSREDLSKPENRVNVALFGCMTIPELKRRLLERLSLDPELVIRPERVPNSPLRPDFAARRGGMTVAYIEVELGGRNDTQGESYRKMKKPVYWIVGKKNYRNPRHDLSLEEIQEIADEVAKTANAQAKENLKHLSTVIEEGLGNAKETRSELRPNLPPWFLARPGLEVIAKAIQPLIDRGLIQNWTSDANAVSLRLIGLSQDVAAGRRGFALITARGRDTDTILVPTTSELKLRLRGRLESWSVHYADVITQMLANSPRRLMGNGREQVSAKAFDQHCAQLRELFIQLVYKLKNASI